MSNDQSQRIRALKVYEILCQETDEDNPLGTTLLISKLKLSGIECDRKTLYKKSISQHNRNNIKSVRHQGFKFGDGLYNGNMQSSKKTSKITSKLI